MKHWLRYIEFKKDAPKTTINLIYERALKELPGRYHNLLILIKKKKIITLKEDICNSCSYINASDISKFNSACFYS